MENINWKDTYPEINGKTYFVTTFGCQMNMHDSERVAGLLESCGARAVDHENDADIICYMTCCVRENADQKLYGTVSRMKSAPASPSGQRVVCVGGCIAQRDGDNIRRHMSNVDVVFGTQAIGSLPRLICESFKQKDNSLHIDTIEAYKNFSTDYPSKRVSKYQAWLPIMTGCNNFCTYCIVPYVRGREASRTIESIVSELEGLIDDGVREVTLLGQNVNSYGKNIYGKDCFADLLREVGKTGIERVRFTSSNPHDLSDDIIEAMADTPCVMPHLHLAVQSGSNKILKAMNRKYTAEKYIEVADKLRNTIDDFALTTDIIVGFPGETEQDFQQTLDLVNEVEFASAFTFIYSPRPGTPAARMKLDLTHEVIQDRFDRLVLAVQDNANKANLKDLGKTVEVLVESPSKKDSNIMTGHSEKNTTVHFPLLNGKSHEDMIGKLVNVKVDEAKTWYLKGDVVGDLH